MSTEVIRNIMDMVFEDLDIIHVRINKARSELVKLEKKTINAKSGQEIFNALKLFLDELVLLQSSVNNLDDNATMAAQALDPVMKKLDKGSE